MENAVGTLPDLDLLAMLDTQVYRLRDGVSINTNSVSPLPPPEVATKETTSPSSPITIPNTSPTSPSKRIASHHHQESDLKRAQQNFLKYQHYERAHQTLALVSRPAENDFFPSDVFQLGEADAKVLKEPRSREEFRKILEEKRRLKEFESMGSKRKGDVGVKAGVQQVNRKVTVGGEKVESVSEGKGKGGNLSKEGKKEKGVKVNGGGDDGANAGAASKKREFDPEFDEGAPDRISVVVPSPTTSSVSPGGLAGFPPAPSRPSQPQQQSANPAPPPPIPRHAFLESPLPPSGPTSDSTKSAPPQQSSAATLGLGLYSLSNPQVKTPAGAALGDGLRGHGYQAPPNPNNSIQQPQQPPPQTTTTQQGGHYHSGDVMHSSHACPNCARGSWAGAGGGSGQGRGGGVQQGGAGDGGGGMKLGRTFVDEMAGLGVGGAGVGGGGGGDEGGLTFSKVSTSSFLAAGAGQQQQGGSVPPPSTNTTTTLGGWPSLAFQVPNTRSVPPPPASTSHSGIRLSAEGVPVFEDGSGPAFLPSDWRVPVSPRPVGLGTLSFFNQSGTTPSASTQGYTNSSGVAVPQLPLPVAPFSFRESGPGANHNTPSSGAAGGVGGVSPSPPLWFPNTSGIPTEGYNTGTPPPPFALSSSTGSVSLPPHPSSAPTSMTPYTDRLFTHLRSSSPADSSSPSY
ncbi:hypothetical protein HK097_003222, partial [Rhizophlyctis rosea]